MYAPLGSSSGSASQRAHEESQRACPCVECQRRPLYPLDGHVRSLPPDRTVQQVPRTTDRWEYCDYALTWLGHWGVALGDFPRWKRKKSKVWILFVLRFLFLFPNYPILEWVGFKSWIQWRRTESWWLCAPEATQSEGADDVHDDDDEIQDFRCDCKFKEEVEVNRQGLSR